MTRGQQLAVTVTCLVAAVTYAGAVTTWALGLFVLPGVITFDLFGHEIELMPRTLVINKKEVPWKSESVIELWPTNKLPQPLKPAHHDEPR